MSYTSIQAACDVIQANISVGNIDDDDATDKHYTGNPYPSYAKKVVALTRMYDGRKDWGCDVARNVVDVRAAFLIGSGVQVVKSEYFKGSAERELDFTRKFIAFNNINEEIPQEWSKYAEIEGKFLAVLEPTKNNVRAIHKPWYQFAYWIDYDPNDLGFYVRAFSSGASKAKYRMGSTVAKGVPDIADPFDLPAGEFVYKRFGGSASQVNETPSKTALVLRDIQDLDKAMWDWRKINHLYASPTPVFSFEDSDVARKFKDSVEYKNWRIGKGIVMGGKGEFTLECYVGEGYTTVKDEIVCHARKISGATGVPVHFFGYPDLLSNRDTADNLVEGIVLSTNKERKTWIGFYQELFRKAILMYNRKNQQDLNPDAVDARIPAVSSAKFKEIEKVWLPMYMANAISIETLLDQLGDVETENEIERIKNEAVPKLPNTGDGGGQNQGNDLARNNRKNKGNRSNT